ncbi:hypothetical protein WK55_22090 [Burkholderia ubonensis]|uniref:InvB/SpaK family type III secretion system chaperone n=1 Tax=Burkholderia ubonensis TaxID=101571 RepID=UPI00075AF81B|nr:hypothetical protein [Burkholderia ubonensis]KVT54027.1 hypothetical protein WK55_22090 [Burkholderia ubonensis]
MNIDIVKLVRDSMERMGCANLVDEHLDGHSPICLGFGSVPDMFVECEPERIKIWSKLDYRGDQHLSNAAPDLLGYLMPRLSSQFVNQRPLLSLIDEELILHGQLDDQCAGDVEAFTDALELFYEDLCAIHEILSR